MLYYTVLLPWIVYFFLERIFFEKNNKYLFLPVLFLFFSLSFLSIQNYKFAEIFLFLYFVFLHFYFLRNLSFQIKFLFLFWYFSLFIFYIYAEGKVDIGFFIPITLITLAIRPYKRLLDAVFWVVIIVLNIAVSLFYFQYLPLSASLLSFFMLNLIVRRFLIKTEKDKINYKRLIERALQTEVQNKLFQAESHLEITTKKLKAIFKISNYTVSTTDINLMAERILDGLLNIGYTGIVVYIDSKNILKKGGYFPNFKQFEEDIKSGKWQEYKKSYINNDERFLILPLQVGKEKLGFLAVYKKDGLPSKEVEYLSTYTNSVAIAVANITHFEELIKLQELTYKVFENLDIGIAVVDENLNIEMVNNAFKQMSSFKGNERNIIEILPEITHLKKDLIKVKETLKPFETELASLNQNRRTFRIKILPLVVEELKTPKIIILVEDITEKEQLENQIIETEKLAVIGKMAAGLSHDIKTPLAVIESAVFRIKKRVGENEEVLQFLEKIKQQTKRAEKIINRLLNYAKPSYWQIEYTNLKEILEEALEIALHSKDSKLKIENINIKTNIEADLFVEGDKTALQQVFINLIINAFEAIEGKGFSVPASVEISLDKDKDYAKVIIKDTGIGISKENLKKIFDPFYTTKERGTGLGLAVVKRILEDHRGLIEVISKKGEGTTFIIKLPLSKEKL